MHVANPAVMYSLPCTAAVYQQPQVPTPGYAPPIQALNIPAPFHGGGFSQGHGGRGNGGPTWHHTGHGERGLNPFRNAGQGAGTVFVPGGVVIPPYGPYLPAVAPVAAQCNFTPTPVKKFNNWKVCYSCGFDIKDKHTGVTCPIDWHRTTHCKKYLRNNVQAYIVSGHDVCTKGIHKMMLPQYHLA
jgi:hypothetical protein